MLHTNTKNRENLHNDVFGETFALYDQEEIKRFIRPFEIRFERNHLNPTQLFSGKKCLDAGCGNGRGSLFMAMHGGQEIHSLDISPLNVKSTKRNAALFHFDKIINVQQSSLEKIPYEDETFDFVWCNGVIMHTHNPDECLKELSRVLKKGGKAWIYVYGSGGVYWYSVYKFRELLKEHSEKECFDALQFVQTPVSFLAEYMDDWKAPYLRTYTNHDFSNRLKELGFTGTDPLEYGTDYDTSHRNKLYPEDKTFLGEGDLRYLLTKSSDRSVQEKAISASEMGSTYNYPEVFKEPIDEKFSLMNDKFNNSLIRKIIAFAYLQRNLRDQIFAGRKTFKLNEFLAYFDKAISYLQLL